MIGARILKGLAKRVGSPIVDLAGVYTRRAQRVTRVPGSWTIVMYHRVIDDPALDPFRLGMCVTRENFDAQVRWLRSRFNILPVAQCMRRLEDGQALPERALSVTFDDGYLDNLVHALPIMLRHGVPFTVFVPSGGMDSDEMFWWDRVISAMARTRVRTLDLRDLSLPLATRLSLDGAGRAQAVELLLSQLWALPNNLRVNTVRDIEAALKSPAAPQIRPRRLAPEHVRDLHRQGAEIGAHSVSHGNLLVASRDEVRCEMRASRACLEQLLQSPVDGFAYPGGYMGAETIDLAREQGFKYAMAATVGANGPPYERFALRRIGMPDSPPADFRRAFSAALERGTHQRTALPEISQARPCKS
jgi:peptidoglycan/xylan/chitin deacetylase (PgdA/CDA1 family)